LLASERVQRVVDHWLEHCRGCGHPFSLAGDAAAPKRRKVIALPRARAEIHVATLPTNQQVRAAVRASTAGRGRAGWKKKRLRCSLWVAATPTLSFYRLNQR